MPVQKIEVSYDSEDFESIKLALEKVLEAEQAISALHQAHKMKNIKRSINEDEKFKALVDEFFQLAQESYEFDVDAKIHVSIKRALERSELIFSQENIKNLIVQPSDEANEKTCNILAKITEIARKSNKLADEYDFARGSTWQRLVDAVHNKMIYGMEEV